MTCKTFVLSAGCGPAAAVNRAGSIPGQAILLHNPHVLTPLAADMTELPVYAIVLAAGSATRFGTTKQLETYEGAPLVRRTIRMAEQVCAERSVLVVGHDWRDVAAACSPLRGFLVRNTGYNSGMAGSIRAGVHSVRHAAAAILLLLADQPLVDVTHLGNLVSRWKESPDDVVASRYAGVLGPPIVFPARLFDALMRLRGDEGARRVVSADDRVQALEFEMGAVDIDRRSDLSRLEGRAGERN